MREFQPEVHLLNLTWKVGTLNMLQVAESIVLPAIFSGKHIKQYGVEMFILHPSIVHVKRSEGQPEPAVLFQLVVNTKLTRDQTWDEKTQALKTDPRELKTAPSAWCLLLLSSHRVVMFHYMRFSPKGSRLTQILKALSRPFWEQWIEDRVPQSRGEVGAQRRALKERYPNQITVLNFPSKDSIDTKVDRFSVLSKLTMKIRRTNSEVDYSGVYDELREQNEELGGTDVTVRYQRSEGLNPEKAKEAVEISAKSANIAVILQGKDQSGNPLRVENADISVRVPVNFDAPEEPDEIEELPQQLLEEIDRAENSGVIPPPRNREDDYRRAEEVAASFRRRAG